MSVHIPAPVRAVTPTASRNLGFKAGPLGPGAGPLMTEYHISSFLPRDPREKMKSAWNLGQSVAYVFASERVIAGKLSTVPWHLEDPDGETIDDEYPDARAREAFTLLEKPMANVELREVGIRRSRRQIWELTGRHIGLCGNSAWMLDQMDGFGIPRAILYIRPDRLSPDLAQDKVLMGWRLDAGSINNREGTPLDLMEVMLFHLQAPNEGFFSTGLVEAALIKANLNGAIDKHFAQVIAGGGRLSGIIAPKEGAITDDNTYSQMVNDWRNVTEQPESARRAQIVRAPVEFIKTVNTPQEMSLIELMGRNRDDLLALWGVPYSQVGGSPAAGMNGGEARDSDKAALWENAVMPRLEEMREQIQLTLLDRWEAYISWAPTLVIDYPDLESTNSKYAKAQQSSTIPMRNWERRGLIGLDPFGPGVIGTTGAPLDDEIWVPLTIQPLTAAPEGSYTPPEPEPEPVPDEETVEEEEIEDGVETESEAAEVAKKARSLIAASTKLRTRIQEKIGPAVATSVAKVLAEQKQDVIAKVTAKWDAIVKKPNDVTAWWKNSGPGGKSPWDTKMADALRPSLSAVASAVSTNIQETVAPKQKASLAATAVVDRVLRSGAGRVRGINETTRDGVRTIIAQGVKEGLSPAAVGDLIEKWSGWNEYRAERIATTELQFAYNAAAVEEYKDLGVTHVEAIDGDEDEECAERNGQIFTVEEAADIVDHPNGTLDWAPVIE